MQTVLAFAAKALSAVGVHTATAAATTAATTTTTTATTAASAAATAGATAATAAQAVGWGSKVLSALRVGTSVVSALSVAGQSQMQAEAQRQQAGDETLQATQGFVQGQENANTIQRQYNAIVQNQMAVAAAEGIDVSSGSVIEARQDAQREADRQTTIARTGIEMNAAIRQGRASFLTGAAATTSQTGYLSAAAKVGQAALDARRVG